MPSDHPRVFAVHEAAFGRPNEATLVDALRASAHPQISLVADVDGEVVGHVFFSPVSIQPAAHTPPLAGLAPVAVHPTYQGRGIGAALIRAGLQRCSQYDWRAVFLVGNPAYYSRFGFVLAAPLNLTYGDPAFDRALQVVELTRGALDGCRGRVCFHPAFAEAGTG